MKVTVDQENCIGCGVCSEMSPDIFELNDEDLAQVTVEQIDANHEEPCREAARECPVEAIIIEE